MDNQINQLADTSPESHKPSEQRSKKNLSRPQRGNFAQIFLVVIALLFSFYLMFHTFSYDANTHNLLIASKAWSDFGAHIPLIRSFSYGPNMTRLIHGQPVESPLYPGEPIRYHFGFYAFVGLLEKLGMRLDWALNIPSALGFFLLMLLIYLLSYKLFKKHAISLLSVVFFLFNGSLSFLRFFQNHPLNPGTLSDIMTNSRFPAFGPWDNGDITAFWTLNIYTNQRHLAISYALILAVIILMFYPPKKFLKNAILYGFAIALLVGVLLFFNYPAAAILGLWCVVAFLVNKEVRLSLIIAFAFSTPAIALLFRVAHIGSSIAWQPGYLATPVTPGTVFTFWRDNLGLHILLVPLGLLLAPKNVRRIFLVPMIILFTIPNLYRFSPDMINNHKFFNFFLILGNMFSAYLVVSIIHQLRSFGWVREGYEFFRDRFPSFKTKNHFERDMRRDSIEAEAPASSGAKKFRNDLSIPTRLVRWTFGLILIVLLIFSGVIDLFPIINDTKGSIADVTVSPDAEYIRSHTNPTDVIANSTWFYHPASLAGRSLFSGYTYFTWSYGYDQIKRETMLKNIYAAPDIPSLCALLATANVNYIELNPKPESYLQPNLTLWNSLLPAYENPMTHLKIFDEHALCPKEM